MSPARRFPPPWSAEVQPNYYVLRDANGQQLAYVYFSNDPDRHSAAKLLTKDEARRDRGDMPKYQSHCCPNIIRNGDKLLLRNQATKIAISLRGQIEAIMRANTMILALPVFAIFALVYTARTHDRTHAGFYCTVDCSGHEAGYRWAEQHSIDDEDYCPDGDSESFYEGCIAYVRGMPDQADSGVGVGTDEYDDGPRKRIGTVQAATSKLLDAR